MDASTRPPQKRHQAFAHLALCLVAVLSVVEPLKAATNNQIEASHAEQKLIPAPAAHDIAITTVAEGQEALQLSARFTDDGTEIIQDVSWIIRNENNEIIFKGLTSQADAALPPGDYQVEATYGTAHIIQSLTLLKGTKLDVSFVLNVGGLRLLPRVQGIATTVASRTLIYALGGKSNGQLITSSHVAGEVIKITAGTYRIESRFEGSNAVAVTDVVVKSSKTTAVQIDHKAGLANLSLSGNANASALWTITDDAGAMLPPITGATASLVLKPGHYLAKASMSGTIKNTEFNISVGQTLNIALDQK